MEGHTLTFEAISGHLLITIGEDKAIVHDKRELKAFASKFIDKRWKCLSDQIKESKK